MYLYLSIYRERESLMYVLRKSTYMCTVVRRNVSGSVLRKGCFELLAITTQYVQVLDETHCATPLPRRCAWQFHDLGWLRASMGHLLLNSMFGNAFSVSLILRCSEPDASQTYSIQKQFIRILNNPISSHRSCERL